jgi:serine protease Do
LGSGFIVDKTGYIITNFHVVEKADTINVTLASGDDYKAKVIGKDEGTDIAIIKIEANKELPTLKLGNSEGMSVGDWVLAIGSPFGLEQTVTAGIISATGRGNAGQPFQRFLQTDAAINPGNSGGPLLNMAGEVIGVNTAIVSPNSGFAGIGFALPSNNAANIYNQLVKTGKVTRGAIGIQMQPGVSSRTLKAMGSPDGKGVLVNGFSNQDSPAEKAGLKKGDIIVAIDGKKVNDSSELTSIVVDLPPGKTADVKYLRDGKEGTTQITVGDRKNLVPDDAASVSSESSQGEVTSRLGCFLRIRPRRSNQPARLERAKFDR